MSASSVPHGFRTDERRQLLRLRPPAHAIAWVEAAVGGRVTSVRALAGGVSSAVHALRVVRATTAETIVLRRYILPELNLEDPDIAAREVRTLALLRSSAVPAPRVLAVDATGASAGVPTVVMTRVPGRLDWKPSNEDAWLRGLASALPAIHAVAHAGTDVPAFAPYAPESWDCPPWLRQPSLWERAIAIYHGPPLDTERVFVHRDYHPGNVLWRRGRVSGVVDWQAASIGPPSVDVGWCRLNLIRELGAPMADRLVGVWEGISGRTYHPWAEIVLLVDMMSWAGRHRADEAENLERALAQRLAELG